MQIHKVYWFNQIGIAFWAIFSICEAITDVEQAFIDYGITPDTVPVAPTKLLTVCIRDRSSVFHQLFSFH